MNPRERRLQAIFLQSPIGMFRSTPAGQFLEVNPAAASLLGYDSPEEMIALVNRKGIAATIFHNPADRAAFVEQMRAHYGEWQVREIRYRRKDGGTLDAILSICLQQDDEFGEPAFFGFLQDITERKQQEAERQRTEKLMLLGMLSSGVAHDFNNLLAGILGYVDLLRDAQDLSEVRALADRLQKGVHQARGLTARMLGFTRDRGMEPEAFCAHDLVHNAVALFQAGNRTRTQVVLDLAAPACTLVGYPDQFQNAVLNLCLNARDAMPAGGRLEIASAQVDGRTVAAGPGPGAIPPGACLWVAIRDAGTGMAKEVLAHCLDPFFTTKPEGTGLGLPSVKGAVLSLGGAMRIASRIGEGSCFSLYLPLAE
jgi:PAS domain S-box-containing protein